MADFPFDNLLQAVNAIYGSSRGDNIREIDAWLSAFQMSGQAWTHVNELFSKPELPIHCYVFAAMTLKTKLTFDFAEVAAQDTSTFRHTLLQLLVYFHEYDIVTRQLAQCVGVLAVQTSTTWGEAMLGDLQLHLSSHEKLLLYVLRSLAEESENETIVVDSEHRTSLTRLLISICPRVVAFLQVCSGHKKLVLECFLAWLKFGLDNESLSALHNSPLIQMCFETLNSPEYFTTACESICELIKITEDVLRFEQTIASIVQNVLSLAPLCRQAIAQQDEEKVSGLVKVFTTFGQTHMQLILKQKDGTGILQTLEVLLDFFSLPKLIEVREFSRFWHMLGRLFNQVLTEAEILERREFFNPFMMRLLGLCVQHCKLSVSWLQKVEQGLKLTEDLEEQRLSLSDTIYDISLVVGFEQVFEVLQKGLEQASSADLNPQALSQAEAIIVCMTGMASKPENEVIINNALNVVVGRQWPSVQVNRSICQFIKTFSSHIRTELLATVMQFLTNVLSQPHICLDGASAFVEVCQINRHALIPFVEDLLKVAGVALSLPESPRENVLEGVGWVVLQSPTDTVLRANLEKLCAPFALRLSSVVQELTGSLSPEAIAGLQAEVIGILSILGTLFKSSFTTSASPETVYHIFRQLWQYIYYFARAFESSEELIEKVLRIVKYSMRKCRTNFASHLTELVSLVTLGFSRYPYSAYLYTSENLVRVYGDEVGCFDMLSQLFLTLTNTVVGILNSYEAIKDKPEITEDFFGMVVRYISYCSPAVLQSDALNKILSCAKLGIGIEQPDAANCLYGFIIKLLTFADENSRNYNQRLAGELKLQFAEIEQLVVRALVSAMPRIIVENIVDLLVTAQKIFPTEDWLASAVLNEVPHDCLTALEKQKMVQEAGNPDKLQHWIYSLNRRAHVRAKRSKK